MVLLRALARVVGAVLMLVVALLALGVALYCLDALISLGSARPDRLLNLPSARAHVGHFLAQLEAPGPTAGLALVCGLGAMIIGLLLLIGALRPARRRLAVLETVDGGTLAGHPRALRAIARALAERGEGVTSVRRPRIALSRRGTRGRLRVRATRTPSSSRQGVEQAIQEQLTPVSEPFHLRPRVQVRLGGRGDRVQ